MVLFRLDALRAILADQLIGDMFSIPPGVSFDQFSHAVLTPAGALLASASRAELVAVRQGVCGPAVPLSYSLWDRFHEEFSDFPVDDADCLGMGELPPEPPVVLFLRISSGFADATARFHQEPAPGHDRLLGAVGVEYLGGQWRNGAYMARYRNHVPTHAFVGRLANFERTNHCNLFFLRHGRVDGVLEAGLRQALAGRVAHARRTAVDRLVRVAVTSLRSGDSALTCLPPPPSAPYPYGDLVPLGFVLRALRSGMGTELGNGAQEAETQLRRHLHGKRQNGGWSYHTGGLVTATDSVLVLQGFPDVEVLSAIERFADEKGRYYPQLWSEVREPERMARSDENRHWCQPDFPTTCLVTALRAEAGLPDTTPPDYFAANFEHRSGLYFANPYLVDWALAWALSRQAPDHPLRHRLATELVASANQDGTFGSFDITGSTALAVLSLKFLDTAHDAIELAQLRLVERMNDAAKPPSFRPFYSTLALPNRIAQESARPPQVITVAGQPHAVTYYRDDQALISTALVVQALSPELPAHYGIGGAHNGDCHRRYRCSDQEDYITRFALPPYLVESGGPSSMDHRP